MRNMKTLLNIILFLFPTIAFSSEASLGAFVGAHAGFLHAKDAGYETHNGSTVAFQTIKLQDPAFGFSLGYHKALSNFLLGIESSLEIVNAKQHTYQQDINGGAFDEHYLVHSKIEKTISLLPQFGYILNDRGTLAFLSSGYTMTRIKRGFGNTTTESEQRISKWHKGWAFGLGMAHMIKNSLFIKAEFKHSTYNDRTLDTMQVYCCTTHILEHQSYKQNQATIGIHYYLWNK